MVRREAQPVNATQLDRRLRHELMTVALKQKSRQKDSPSSDLDAAFARPGADAAPPIREP
jgi:hypothetical protein